MEQIVTLKDYATTPTAMEDVRRTTKPAMIDLQDAILPHDDLLNPDSPTTLDITAAPHDELLMEFSSAASASNTSSNFIGLTKGPDLFALPLSVGIAVSGILVNDATTLTEPFLPGDHVMACILPPKPVLLSAHNYNLRLRIQTNAALEVPDTMAPEQATSYMTSLLIAASILKEQLHIPLVRTPSASPDPAADSGIASYNNKRILIVGGQTPLAAAMTQLLRRALPETKILLTSSIPCPSTLRHRTDQLIHLGASYAVDGEISNLSDVLPPSVDILINCVAGMEVRKEVLGLLDGLQKFVDVTGMDVEGAVAAFVELEPDCVTSLHGELLRAGEVFGGVEEEGF
ncbi:uncharacterized protein MYCFIDRAFT_211672 [Pseudocercospora fijiensis CIRAD86]|uniref:Enoyl reductase (ER) domain-containing protein n=1 Tax=Pseudocercospora fijiensis (strain CIRAD86) TaxID=383855 RepID=M2YSY4_PSEFD|nr:uncharacterized protein MYCFIDRAFT_211672 [Pseudocercospora fijiensis CIRAD86]EME80815.1 hypothetical protein MYCFIDRAFT_211672 [Pseudocercospora fijiensis CIRAD86]